MTDSPPSYRPGLIFLLLLIALIGWLVQDRLQQIDQEPAQKNRQNSPVPVKVSAILHQPITWRRMFTGSIQASAEFIVAPRVGGRIIELNVDLADTVQRGDIVARLDNEEYIQAVKQAQADLAVARANLVEAQNLLTISERELQRIDQLKQRGISSESQRDTAQADQLARQAHVEVSLAQIQRAEAVLQAARIRLSYTGIKASWNGEQQTRVVAERLVEEGETVGANTPLLRIVSLNPVKAVIYAAEQDYAMFQPGQLARLSSDAFAQQTFSAKLSRIAPVFSENTRQARIEFEAENQDLLLKPGMFVNLTVDLKRVEQAVVVPQLALTTRDEQTGVFVLPPGQKKVSWQAVDTGIETDTLVQIVSPQLEGQVVVLGQQLLKDGAPIQIVDGPLQ